MFISPVMNDWMFSSSGCRVVTFALIARWLNEVETGATLDYDSIQLAGEENLIHSWNQWNLTWAPGQEEWMYLISAFIPFNYFCGFQMEARQGVYVCVCVWVWNSIEKGDYIWERLFNNTRLEIELFDERPTTVGSTGAGAHFWLN